MAPSPPTSNQGHSNASFVDVDLQTEQNMQDLHETIADRLLKLIVPWAAVLSLVVLVGELVNDFDWIRLVPSIGLTILFGYLVLFPNHGRPLRRTWVIIVSVYLAMAYLGWAVQSFRAPGVIGLATILITWTCLFTSRKFAIGVLCVLLGSSAVIFGLMRSGVYVEQPLSPAPVSILILSGIYVALFVSVLAPIRILFESVAASRRSEQIATEALAQLRKSQEFTVQAVDHSLHLFGWLSADGQIQFANATALGMIRTESAKVVGRYFWDTPWFSDAPEEQRKLREAVSRAAQGETVRYETLHRNWNGAIREIELSLHPIVESDGTVTRLIAEGRDITDEHEAIRQKDAISERLHQSQKMEVIGQLTGGVAHDFNNSLTTISGLAQILKDGGAEGAQREEFLGMILDATRNASNLTRRLLAFSRKESRTLDTPLDLAAIVSDVATMLRRTQDKRVTISVHSDLDVAIVMGDESMLQNAFLNMGINAFHAMPDGGRLEFALRERHLDSEASAKTSPPIPPGDYFELEVRDTGCGMAPEVASRIFEPFFTTKAPGKGTGLGMSMVLDSLKELGGAISVDSSPGEGTTFKVHLPKAPQPET